MDKWAPFFWCGKGFPDLSAFCKLCQFVFKPADMVKGYPDMLSGAAFQKSLLIYNAVAYSEDYALHHNERGNRLQRMTQWKRTGKIMINQQI